MTITWGQGVDGAEKHDALPLTCVGEAIQRKDGEEALRLLTSGYLVPFEERGLGTLQQIILNCPNPKLIEAVIEKMDLHRINALDSSDNNAMMTAAKCGNIAVIKRLVKARADVNLSNSFQQTPLYQVLKTSGNQPNQVPATTVFETIHCLLGHGASMEIADKSGKTAIRAYVYLRGYNTNIITYLVSEGAEPPYKDVRVRLQDHASIISAAIQTGLNQRRTAVSTALTSQLFPLELLNLIYKYI